MQELRSKNLAMLFAEDASAIKSMILMHDCTNVCAKGELLITIRTPTAVSDPAILTATQARGESENGLNILFSDEGGKYTADLALNSSEDGIHFRMQARAPEPVWLVEWKLDGLKLDEVLIPALGGQKITGDMPSETTLSYKYPFWWNAQFVIGCLEGGGIWLRSKDKSPSLKLLRVGKTGRGFSFVYGFEAPAPLLNNTLEAEWFMDAYEGDWTKPVEIYRAWMQRAFQVKHLSERDHWPAWAEKINFILEIWGARKDRNVPLHTFERMTQRLHEWRKLHSPEHTLVYLPGFAENGIDSHAPDYNPSPLLGGSEKFGEFIQTAHSMGYRVMIHTNVLAMTFSHRLYRQFKDCQVIDAFGRPQGWGLDLDGDWLTEPYFAYINPGYEEWTKLMTTILGELINLYKIDGIFLDQTLLAFNVSDGPNFIQGMRNHIRKLQNAFTDILFAGEGLHEQILPTLAMAQIHGIDSIANVHGMERRSPWRQVHPVSAYLFGKFARLTAHLLTQHPSQPMFKFQESAYAELGVIPALCLYDNSQPIDLPEVRKMIERAKSLSKEWYENKN